MKQYGTYWLQKLVLLTSFCLLASCGSPEIDQSAINRLENGVAGYKKILLDMQNAGISEAEFKKNWNAANFGLRDAITYLEAKKIHTADLNPMILNDTVDRWSRYLEAYQFGSEGKVWAGSKSNDRPSRMGWDKPHNEADNNCISLSQMIGLIKQFPQLRLLYLNKKLDSYSEVPENVQKEILAYVPSYSEPYGFLRHFQDYCSSDSYGFHATLYGEASGSWVKFSLQKAEVNHILFTLLKSEVEELDRKLKELAK